VTRWRDRSVCLVACWVAAMACPAGEAPPAGWRECLPGGTLEVAAGSTVVVAEAGREAFDLEIEVRWTVARRGAEGGFELAFGPHGVGSSGYRFVVQREPWRTVECLGARLAHLGWHRLSIAVRRDAIEYRLNGERVVRVAAEAARVRAIRLSAGEGATAAMRRCRLRTEALAPVGRTPVLVYPCELFAPGLGKAAGLPDRLARGGRAATAYGRGRSSWLVDGQDATLPTGGRYVAHFALRGGTGAGAVWLEVARSGGGVLARKTLRLEELPGAEYLRVPLPFVAEVGQPLEYRVAAERGSLRVDDVEVVPVSAQRAARGPAGLRRRPRRALSLHETWEQDDEEGTGLRLLALRRRLAEGGWYAFEAAWRQGGAERLDAVAVDVWVVCRDRWGRVRNLTFGAAYDAVPRGEHATVAWLSAGQVARYGWPVALFARLYWRGRPVAKRWRKWGIPVDDQWILPAAVVGTLRAAPTE